MSGTPTIFKSLTKAGLKKKVDRYFEHVNNSKGVASLTGLALHLGCTRKNIIDYKDTDEFGDVLAEAKLRCENILEERMINGTPPTGIIFILKNNYGWNDKIEVDNRHSGVISLAALFNQAAQQRALEGRKQEVVEGEIIETEAPDLLFDDEPETKHELPEELF